MKKHLKQFLFALSAVVGLASSTAAQIDRWGYWENGVSEPWWFSAEQFTKADADAAIMKWNQIGEELISAKSDRPPGHYFSGGETHGTYFRWSGSGFVMVNVDKCQAKVMGLRFGKVESTPSKIVFTSEFTNVATLGHSHGSAATLLVFIPVKYRGAWLLVAENELSDFGDYVAGLGKYNYSNFTFVDENEFFVKAGGSPVKDNHVPELPEGYERYLKEPITGSITAIKSRTIKKSYSYENPDGTGASYEEPVSLTTVTIDVGAERGLKPGMFLRVMKPGEGDEVRVMRVGKFSSTGIIIRDLTDGKEMFFDDDAEKQLPHSPVLVGWRLTTSPLR